MPRITKEKLLERGSHAQRESKYVDFKESCDVESVEMWCEIIKDIVAMANSGGGLIVFGVKNDGTPSGFDGAGLLLYDTAKVTDKIAKYTNRQFAEHEFGEVRRHGKSFTSLIIGASTLPIVFTKAGTYRAENGKEKTAFQQGTVYFRHGAKSEPGDSDDLKDVIDREVERLRTTWLDNIKKVTQAPADSVIQVNPRFAGIQTFGQGLPARIVADEGAPGVRPEAADTLWPHRAKDLIAAVNKRLDGKAKINTYDVQCVRKVFEIEKKHPEFCYRPFARVSPQYSDAFVDWLVMGCEKDNAFFVLTRQKAQLNQ